MKKVYKGCSLIIELPIKDKKRFRRLYNINLTNNDSSAIILLAVKTKEC